MYILVVIEVIKQRFTFFQSKASHIHSRLHGTHCRRAPACNSNQSHTYTYMLNLVFFIGTFLHAWGGTSSIRLLHMCFRNTHAHTRTHMHTYAHVLTHLHAHTHKHTRSHTRTTTHAQTNTLSLSISISSRTRAHLHTGARKWRAPVGGGWPGGCA